MHPSAAGEAVLIAPLTLQRVNFWVYPESQRSEVRGQVCMLEQLDDSALPNWDPQRPGVLGLGCSGRSSG